MIFFPSYLPHQYVVDMGYEYFSSYTLELSEAIPNGGIKCRLKKINIQC